MGGMSSGGLWHELMNMVNMATWKKVKTKEMELFPTSNCTWAINETLTTKDKSNIWGLDLVEELVYSSSYTDVSVCTGLRILLQNVGEGYGVVDVLELVFSQSYGV